VALEKVAGSSPVGHPKGKPVGTGRETSNRGPRARFRGPPNAIGNAIGVLRVYIARTRQIRSFGSGPFADGVKVANFAEGRMGYRMWGLRTGRISPSVGDRYDHDVDEPIA
jgi:hypothetical protein